MMIAMLHPDMIHTGMHELMFGMFVGGMLLAATPVLLGIGVTVYLLQQRRLERRNEDTGDAPRS
jgi:hypothetical protein